MLVQFASCDKPKDQDKKLNMRLAKLPSDDTVYLQDQKLTDCDIPIVVQEAVINIKCSRLVLDWNKITDKGAEHFGRVLQSNTSLSVLFMNNNQISNRGTNYITQALYTNRTLTELHIRGNQITDEGALFIAQVLYINSTLEELYLADNTIGDRGAQYLALALTQNTTLKVLDLRMEQVNIANNIKICWLRSFSYLKHRVKVIRK
ncbi:unnamed protein product [Rotaria sp. Silwood1]|nr:unnamed protein product [Rotaria sp. Silwood1]CAF1569521.1 unnamed protein product [Rotaria sp. Silwood1]CAF3604960.1 unnamed protein product [Rotaria sp. Silwood1]